MKKRLGISVYPEIQEEQAVIDYIDLAHSYGFARMFTSLLEIDESNKLTMIAKMKKICTHAKNLGWDVILDVNPRVFDDLGITLPDTSFFTEIGATTIRLDTAFDGDVERKIVENNPDINLEINMSSLKTIGNLLREYNIPHDRVIASHNFYPQVWTGLDFSYFLETSKHFKDLGYRTSAFVSSQNGKCGPWPTNDGLCTLEIHRNLPISTQAKHLFATNLIDDVVIGNAFATEEELKSLSEINTNLIELEVELVPEISDVEKKIILDFETHFRRGDIAEYMIRSTWCRIKHRKDGIEQIIGENKPQEFGELYIGNDNFKNYKGELQIILKEMPYDDRKNYVGKIAEHEQFLIEYITPWMAFKFIQKK